jgi:hypothetical protein
MRRMGTGGWEKDETVLDCVRNPSGEHNLGTSISGSRHLVFSWRGPCL